MTADFQQALALYDYSFPQGQIAVAPADPRDSSKLLVVDRAAKGTTEAVFRDIGQFLPKNAVLVLNETKVVPAKLPMARSTGGKVETLVLGITDGCLRVMANRKLSIGEALSISADITVLVEKQDERFWLLRPQFDLIDLPKILDQFGHVPLPPYIKNTPLSRSEQRSKYQSVFAKEEGSVAAPTASLHFTPELLKALQDSGIDIITVTLHVHLGTFAPLTEEQWKTGHLHTETFRISPESVAALERAKKEGRPIVAVGTTAARTLESAFGEGGVITKPSGETNIFIREGYNFKAVDHLITNFHVPKSSLLMLVSAFAGREFIMNAYSEAIEKQFRLFSFGDAMLIL